jgi:hypothetical protein
MKFSQAISQVKWLNSEKINVLKTEMVFLMLVFSWFNHLTKLMPERTSFYEDLLCGIVGCDVMH